MLNIALIGAGKMGKIHAHNLALCEKAALYCIVDPDLAAAKNLARRFGSRIYDTAEQAFEDCQVDAVIIASTTESHADLIKKAAAAQKAIFCEGPVALNLSELDECIVAVATNDVPCLLGFNRRFDPDFRELYRRVRRRDMGDVEAVMIVSRDPAGSGATQNSLPGGLFRDFAIQDLDMTRWLLGEEPTEVFATASCLVNPQLIAEGEADSAMIVLKGDSGALCHIHHSRHSSYGYDQRIEVFGSRGQVRAHNHPATAVESVTRDGVAADNPPSNQADRYQEAYRLEMEHFIDVIDEGIQPYTTLQDGRKALLLAEAAYLSTQAHRAITVSEVETPRISPALSRSFLAPRSFDYSMHRLR